jgi:DNA-binding IclR family transcriptional regulator
MDSIPEPLPPARGIADAAGRSTAGQAPGTRQPPPGTAGPAGHPAGTGRVTGVGVLDRCVGLLDLLAGGPRSLRWLAEASALPRPTAHRLLVALEAHRLVARDPAGAFRLGPRLTELAAVAGPELDLASLAGPVLDRLHQATGESVQLYVRSGGHRLCIAARDASTGLRDSVAVGALLPLGAGSGGKVLLAWSADPADSAGVAGRGGGSPVVPAELAAARSRGWAASVAEREAGVASVSAPVLRDGTLLGALCVSGPVSRLGQSPGRKLAAEVTAAAAELSRQLTDPG